MENMPYNKTVKKIKKNKKDKKYIDILLINQR
jgi:hypothetical protein